MLSPKNKKFSSDVFLVVLNMLLCDIFTFQTPKKLFILKKSISLALSQSLKTIDESPIHTELVLLRVLVYKHTNTYTPTHQMCTTQTRKLMLNMVPLCFPKGMYIPQHSPCLQFTVLLQVYLIWTLGNVYRVTMCSSSGTSQDADLCKHVKALGGSHQRCCGKQRCTIDLFLPVISTMLCVSAWFCLPTALSDILLRPGAMRSLH